MFEQGSPYEKVLVVDLSSSSDEEGLLPDTSWDEEFARRLFGDLNRGVLGPPGDGKVIILSDSDEEEEVCDEAAANAEVASYSAVKSRAPIASTNGTRHLRCWHLLMKDRGGNQRGVNGSRINFFARIGLCTEFKTPDNLYARR
jgi:hypothetical protein